MHAVAAVLAHQGGWDEILLVAGPILVIVGILAVVKRRVDRMHPPPAAENQRQEPLTGPQE
jgi:hypothetical protein